PPRARPMDACVGFLALGLVLFLFALFGHGLWELGAMLLRLLSNAPEREPAPRTRERGRERCARCGSLFSPMQGWCPSCGLDPEGRLAGELRDLEAATRDIQRLVEHGVLASDLAERVYQGIEARQARLLSVEKVPPLAEASPVLKEALPVPEPA